MRRHPFLNSVRKQFPAAEGNFQTRSKSVEKCMKYMYTRVCRLDMGIGAGEKSFREERTWKYEKIRTDRTLPLWLGGGAEEGNY